MVKIQREKILAPFTTFKIGGSARFFVKVSTEKDLSQAMEFAWKNNLPVFVLGGGSNILVGDGGFNGLVIHNQIRGIKFYKNGKVVAGAGESWDLVVKKCVEKKLAGIECLSGIPGLTGGAAVQNIGAYGQTISDKILSVKTFNTKTGKIKEFKKSECIFGYRGSIFKGNSNYIITQLVLKLNPNGKPQISYQDLLRYFSKSRKPTLLKVRRAVLKIRNKKGMLITSSKSLKSAGSFFKNPMVSKTNFKKISPVFKNGKQEWYWAVPDGKIKLSAARLIEGAGFKKGGTLGNAGISPKHALSLINRGGAKASEIIKLSEKIKSKVYKKFKIELEEEILIVW